MRADKLLEDSAITNWFDSIDAKERTRTIYLITMQYYYCDYTKMTPTQLLKDARDEIKKGLFGDERKIKKYLIDFRKHLKDDRGYAPNTVRINIKGVISFYVNHEIPLPKLPKLNGSSEPLQEHMDIPTKEDLQDALKVCDPLEKAILLVGVASGLSMYEIRHLRIRDVKNVNSDQITTIKLRREKTQIDFMTFLAPEATRAVQDYLAYRGRDNKTSRKAALAKQRVINDNGYLFIKKSIHNSYLKNRNEEERQIDHEAFIMIYRSISTKCRKNTAYGHWNLIRSHNVRKYFYNTLKDSGCDDLQREYWMGHAIDKTRRAYARFDPIHQAEIYKKYAPFLTLEKSLDVASAPEFKAQIAEIEQLKKENQMFVVERSELQDLREQLEEAKHENKEREAKFDKKVEQEMEEMKKLFMKLVKAGGELSPLIERPILTRERLNEALKK